MQTPYGEWVVAKDQRAKGQREQVCEDVLNRVCVDRGHGKGCLGRRSLGRAHLESVVNLVDDSVEGLGVKKTVEVVEADLLDDHVED